MNDLSEDPQPLDTKETLLDSLLEDLLRENTPPDLQAKILERLRTRSQLGTDASKTTGLTAFTDEELDLVQTAATRDLDAGYGKEIPDESFPVTLRAASHQRVEGPLVGNISASWTPALALGGLALAASLMLLVTSRMGWLDSSNSVSQNSTHQASANPDANTNSVAASTESHDPIQPAKGSEQLAVQPSHANESESLAVQEPKIDRGMPQKLPSELIANANQAPQESADPTRQDRMANSTKSPRGKAVALPDRDMTNLIDAQVHYLWNRFEIRPVGMIKSEKWLERVSTVLLGRGPTAAEREIARNGEHNDQRLEIVNRMLDSDEFAKHWAKVLAAYYMGTGIESNTQPSSHDSQFIDWMASSLARRDSISKIEGALFANGSADAQDQAAASHWLIASMERAQASHRDSNDHLSSGLKKLEDREAGWLGVARQTVRIAGGNVALCAQCHVDRESFAWSKERSSETADVSQRDVVWGLAAAFSELSIHHENDTRSLVHAKRAELYYEDANRVLQLAQPVLPDGTRLESGSNPLESISQWFQTASSPRRAIVDVVWAQLFRQPLLPVYGLSEDEGYAERKDLRDLLAEQLQTHGGDIRSIIRWLILSEPFRLEGVEADGPWYLRSPENTIASTQLQWRMFASYPARANMEPHRLPLRGTLAWLKPSESKSLTSNGTLAQPLESGPSKSGNKSEHSNKPEYTDEQVKFLISIKRPYAHAHDIASRFATPNMPWPVALEHAFLISDARFPTHQERDEARKVLDACDQNAKSAIIAILTARMGSW